MNAWNTTPMKADPNQDYSGGTTAAAVTRFSDIMAEQKTEESLNLERLQESKNRIPETPAFESEEERNLRLAIEASLRDCNGNDPEENQKLKSVPTAAAAKEEEEEDMDEELRLILAMSLNEAKQQNNSLPVEESVVSGSGGGEDVLNSKHYAASAAASASASASASINNNNNDTIISEEEARQIAAAIREADDAEHALSLELAMKLEREEKEQIGGNYGHETSRRAAQQIQQQSSNVKLVTRDEYLRQKTASSSFASSSSTPRKLMSSNYDEENDYHDYDENDNYDDEEDVDEPEIGFRLNNNTKHISNSNKPTASSASTWSRRDRATIVGPDGEIRSKHDVELKSKSNAQRLLHHQKLVKNPSDKVAMSTPSINDRAYNDFLKKMKQTKKGVATHGHGRAENMGDDKTRGGALDGNVRMEIQKAINNGIIDRMNGVVKEGKEALVYHADASNHSQDDTHTFDYSNGVAIKVFKRIQEFRQRGAYVNGDPRYHKMKFGKADKRNQVEIWAEKVRPFIFYISSLFTFGIRYVISLISRLHLHLHLHLIITIHVIYL